MNLHQYAGRDPEPGRFFVNEVEQVLRIDTFDKVCDSDDFSDLVRLEMPDEVPAYVVGERPGFSYKLGHAAFSEAAVAGLISFIYGLDGMEFRHCNQLNAIGDGLSEMRYVGCYVQESVSRGDDL